jgi:Putative peptidase family
VLGRATRLLVISLAWVPSAAAARVDGVTLTNFKPDETVRYPVLFLQGTLDDKSVRSIAVTNESSERPTRQLKGLAYQGRFKALTELVPGPNKLILRAGNKTLRVTLNYKPQTNSYLVQVIYMTDRTGNTKYQTPRQNDPQDFRAKLDTTMKLIQCFTAEQMNDLGFGRLTFNLEWDKDGNVDVHKFVSEHPAGFFYPLGDVPLFLAVRSEVETKFNSPRTKRAVFLGFTHYNPKTRKLLASNARGGDGTAETSGAFLWAWPSSLAGVVAAFSDSTRINTRLVADDDDGRNTAWSASNYTAVMLHELQHTWGLPHSRNPQDVISGRGFMYFNRFFTFVDPPSKANKHYLHFRDNEASCIAPESGSSLKNSRWFALDDKPWKDGGEPRFTASGKNGDILIEAEHGLAYLGFDAQGDAAGYESWGYDRPQPPRRYVLTAQELQKLAGTTNVHIRAVDLEGQQSQVETNKLAGK